jgi:hypothetical protein
MHETTATKKRRTERPQRRIDDDDDALTTTVINNNAGDNDSADGDLKKKNIGDEKAAQKHVPSAGMPCMGQCSRRVALAARPDKLASLRRTRKRRVCADDVSGLLA